MTRYRVLRHEPHWGEIAEPGAELGPHQRRYASGILAARLARIAVGIAADTIEEGEGLVSALSREPDITGPAT